MESLSLRLISLLSLCIVFSISKNVVALRTYYVEDRCTPSTYPHISIDYEVGSSVLAGSTSSGILKSSVNGGYRAGLNCKLILKKWGSGGIILTIQKIDFRSYMTDCLTIVNSYDTEVAVLCGSQIIWEESRSYYSNGDFTLYYKTTQQTFDAPSVYDGFQVMYTGYTNYIEELCSSGKMQIYLSHNGSSSAGILSATRHLSYSLHMQCIIRLQAPPGHNVVVSLRDIGFRVLPDGECKDFIKIQEQSTVESSVICQRVRNLDEARSYFSCGDKNFVEIVYSTASDLNNKSMTGYPGVTLTFTAFHYDSSGSCSEDDEFTCENKRCIWKGLACDGHNNCGDLSDENTYGLSNCGYIGSGSMTFVILAVVIVVLAFLVALATLVCYKGRERRRRLTRSKRRTQSTVAILAMQDPPSRRGDREGKREGRTQRNRRCFSLYSTFKSPETSEESAAAERSAIEMEANTTSNSLSRS